MTKDQLEYRKMLLDVSNNYYKALSSIIVAKEHLDLALNRLEKEDIKGLAQFEHYRDHLVEVHRILAAEFERRWGLLCNEIITL